LLLVRRVRLLLLLPPLRACPPHRCQVRQGKEARKGADRASPRGLACAAPSFMWHVHCACFNGLWGRAGLPLTGCRCARAFLCPALGRGLARAWRYARRTTVGPGLGLGSGAGRRPQRSPEPRSKLLLPVCDDAWRNVYLVRSVHLYATRCAR
jgi:hypothetical protein